MKYTILSAALLFGVTAFAQNQPVPGVGNENPDPTSVQEKPSNTEQEEDMFPDNNPGEQPQVRGNIQDSGQNFPSQQVKEDPYAGYERQLVDLNQTIQDLESDIANVNSSLAEYRALVIKYASDLLNIPYDEYTVTEIAIPILKNAINAGPEDDSASAKLSLLENYATNIQQLKTLLNSYISALTKAKTPEEFNEWADKANTNFKYEDVVKTYKKVYPKANDLKKTYLGSIISKIEAQLSKRENLDAKATMLKTFNDLKRQLK